MFLSNDELVALTGLRRPSAIRRWLRAQSIAYIDGADGWPRVLHSVILARLGGHVAALRTEPRLRLRHA